MNKATRSGQRITRSPGLLLGRLAGPLPSPAPEKLPENERLSQSGHTTSNRSSVKNSFIENKELNSSTGARMHFSEMNKS
jgi:hypothetical protein